MDPQPGRSLEPPFEPALEPSPERSLDPALDPSLDLDGIERDLADVEAALDRLDAGTYRTDEITGAPLPPELLAARPTARRDDR